MSRSQMGATGGVPFIVSPNTENLSLRKPASTETTAELGDAIGGTLRTTAFADTYVIRIQISIL